MPLIPDHDKISADQYSESRDITSILKFLPSSIQFTTATYVHKAR
jgi:hypothetical protein